jgi:hypothetical protein
LEGLIKTRRNFILDSLCPNRDSNQALSRYKSEALPFGATCSVYEGDKIKENEIGYVECMGRMRNACKLPV